MKSSSFIRALLSSPLLFLLGAPAAARDTRDLVFVGTYTGQGSEGIYAFWFDPESGQFTPPHLAAKTENPSFLAIDPANRFLYAVNELNRFQGQPSGAVSVFAIDGDSGTLTLLQQVPSLDADPAHLSLDRSAAYLLVANYSGGSVAVFPIQNDGRLGPHTAFRQETGKSVNREHQAGPHADFVRTTPDNRFALSADLGLDKVFLYRFDFSTGSLTAAEPPFIPVKPGSGPRHLAFGRSGQFLYVLNELASTLSSFSIELDSGTIHPIQTLSSLPKGYSGANTAAEIQVDARKRFLYVSNRGHNSLGVFQIDPDSGTLTSVEWVSSGGKTPRHLALDPSGRWLLAANQNSNSIAVFRVDPESGRLTQSSSTIPMARPAFVGFVRPREVYVSTEVAAVLPSAQEEVGNDPTTLRSRLELGDEYIDNEGGPDAHLLTARIDGAPTPQLAFRLDLPYMFLIPRGYPHDRNQGLADVMLRGSAVVKKTNRVGFTGFCDFWFDTAQSTDFGRGKYSAGPGVVTALMNPIKDLMISGLLQHKFSYAGQASRRDIERTKFEMVLDQSIRERYWVVLDPIVYLDWMDDGRTAGDLEMETGIRLGNHWRAWARPGIGVWGQAVSGGYKFYFQAGLRYVFGKPLREKLLRDFGLRGGDSKEW